MAILGVEMKPQVIAANQIARVNVTIGATGNDRPLEVTVQALLDGHVVLSTELAQRSHFPAIDVLRSRSRLMETVAPPQQRADAARIRELMARYSNIELLVQVGEYEKGSDPVADFFEQLRHVDKVFRSIDPGCHRFRRHDRAAQNGDAALAVNDVF